MRLTIDNLDTHGPINYTPVASDLKIHRTLNQPTRCTATILLTPGTILPPRQARVTVTADDTTLRFLGYIATEPIRTYAGESTTGPIYRANLTAIEDEPNLNTPTATFVPGLTHHLTDADTTLIPGTLQLSHTRQLANDVTLTGDEEPTAYITETFQGDGTTAVFNLTRPPFRTQQRTLVHDTFDQVALNPTTWLRTDPGSHIALTGAGLTCTGGNGFDGQTTVAANTPIEMSGTLIAQLTGVQFNAPSDGMLAGMYAGPTALANCMAGFRVRQAAGVTTLVPVVNGAEAGTAFTPTPGHRYTLRLRLHCVEMQRTSQTYSALADGTVQTFGNPAAIPAPMDVVFDLLDEGLSSNTPATILYDSAAASAPIASSQAQCTFVVANSINLFASISTCTLTRPGSAWIISTLPDGTQQTRLTGLPGTGCDCEINYGSANTHGIITFFPGRVPIANERVAIHYRATQRAVARLEDPASIAAEARGSATGTTRWSGKVLAPAARSSADCESAAQAVLALASSRTAALTGACTLTNPAQDIAPGDLLSLTNAADTTALLIRAVTIEDAHSAPEVLHYKLTFANDWATELSDGLFLKLNETATTDATLPTTALTAPETTLPNLQQLTLTTLTTTALQVDTGTTALPGGGFEVRRRDNIFSPTTTADLVLRSPVRSFSIPRTAQVERFYLRPYDASTPPVYSRFSSALFINAPIS